VSRCAETLALYTPVKELQKPIMNLSDMDEVKKISRNRPTKEGLLLQEQGSALQSGVALPTIHKCQVFTFSFMLILSPLDFMCEYATIYVPFCTSVLSRCRLTYF
jgi:hypothetical protein